MLFILPGCSYLENSHAQHFAQIEIGLWKTDKFDDLMAIAASEAATGDDQEET